MTKVCLIDGSGYIFRAFYALPAMTAPNGTPVNAVYGFMTMFMRLIKTISCDYCVVLFDAKRQNFRNQYFAEYKATRAEIPELLIPQFSLIYQAVEALNLPYVLQEGFEADDLIATYAREAEKSGFDTVIVSADKDLMQLIRPHVEFYDGMKDKFFTPEDVKEKFGVYPDKVVDVQALSGDKIDNIPGVPGIGPKTAAELVNTYGSLSAVLEHATEIKQEKRRELLLNNKEAAEISLKLVTLKDDVPVEHHLTEFKCRAPVPETVMAFADRLGFKSIRPKLEKWVSERCCALETAQDTAKLPENKPLKCTEIKDKNALEELKRNILQAQQFAFQLLGNGDSPELLNISVKENETFLLRLPQEKNNGDLFSFAPEEQPDAVRIRTFLQEILENHGILKIACELKTQWHRLNDFCGRQLDLWPYDDIAVMSYDLDSSEHEHNYKTLCEIFLDEQCQEPHTAKGQKTDFTAPENMAYTAPTGSNILRLSAVLKDRLRQEHKLYVYEILDRRLLQVLLQMEEEGITLNKDCLKNLDTEFTKQLQTLEAEICQLAGEEFNPASPKQIGEILFGKMQLGGGKKTANGNYNTGAEVLEQLAEEHEIAAKILEWRMYAKLKSTYTTALLEARDANSRVHTTFSQTVVNTGRLASSGPNLQNIPNRTEIGRQIRGCFVARSGYKIVACDYSQMELRLLASVANVQALKEAFASGKDIHAATAARIFGLSPDAVDREHRSRAKAVNFGIVYGISQFGLAKQIGVSREQAKQYIDSYFAVMPEVKTYMENTIDFARRHGYVLTPLGRKCAIAGINDKNKRLAAFAERASINAPIQGGAADIVKLAMIRVQQALTENRLAAKLLLQVHDELVLEVREDEAEKVAELVKNIMENAAEFDVKMEADAGIGDSWSAAH